MNLEKLSYRELIDLMKEKRREIKMIDDEIKRRESSIPRRSSSNGNYPIRQTK